MTTLPDYVTDALDRMQREAKEREQVAFQRGWDAATSALIQAATNARESALPSKPVDPGEALVAELINAKSNRERVEITLKLRGGMRPIEVFNYMASIGLPVKRSGILTVIKRMRADGALYNRGTQVLLTPTASVKHAA